MSRLFVTASGTDVGKTFVMCRLIRELAEAGVDVRRDVRALKPVVSGFDAGRAESSDPGRLLLAQGLKVTRAHLDRVAPWRFAAPLSADMAAARERRDIPFERLVEFCLASGTSHAPNPQTTLIEGIGGVMAPLDARRTVLDWAAALSAPVVLVVGSYLGTISHTLTAAHALVSRHIDVAAVVISASREQPVPLEETAAVIERFVRPIPVTAIAREGAERSGGEPRLLPLLRSRLG